jgi:death-on-curing protein
VKEPIWVLPRAVAAMHELMIAKYGGSGGVRDQGLLESALARPQQIFNYEEPDLEQLAAAYVAGIVRNHPFVDGNKRTGFVTGFVFLERNGLHLDASEAEATHAVLALASRELTEAQFAAWLRDNVKRTRTRRR